MRVKSIKIAYRTYSAVNFVLAGLAIFVALISFINQSYALFLMFLTAGIMLFITFYKRYKKYKNKETIFTIDGEGIHLHLENKFIPILCIRKVSYITYNNRRCVSVVYSLGQVHKLNFYDDYTEPLESIHDILEHYVENMKS